MIISTISDLISLLDSLENLPIDPPSLYVDLEGVQLGRHGSVSLVSLHVLPLRRTYIIDVHILGKLAFTTKVSGGRSLKCILESHTIPKVVFDIRNDSDALYSHFEVRVNGIIDIQLLELTLRNYPKDFVAGLAKCVEKDLVLSEANKQKWRHVKERGSQLYDPNKGGSYEVFDERPLHPEIVQYCVQDVELLPELWAIYGAKLRSPSNGFWRSMVREATKRRIKDSQHPGYNGQAKSKVCGPWDSHNIHDATEDWNDDVTMWGMNAGMFLDEDDCWSNPPRVLKSSVLTVAAQL
jgi:exonuclease 3'-5' domain-containing protein 1